MTSNLFINGFSIFLVAIGQLFSAIYPNLQVSPLANAQHIHVPEQMDLQQAINQISNGGVIEMAAGTYASPAQGFQISDLHKGFTILGDPGATVTIDGGGARPLVRFINSSLAACGPVQFQNLTFSHGYSNTLGLAAGITVMNAYATFIDTRFTNNSVGGSGTGGATSISNNSTALFINALWQNNTAVNYGAGLAVATHAKVYIHNSQFLNNRANPPGHAPTAAGGAIHVGNSILRVNLLKGQLPVLRCSIQIQGSIQIGVAAGCAKADRTAPLQLEQQVIILQVGIRLSRKVEAVIPGMVDRSRGEASLEDIRCLCIFF